MTSRDPERSRRDPNSFHSELVIRMAAPVAKSCDGVQTQTWLQFAYVVMQWRERLKIRKIWNVL